MSLPFCTIQWCQKSSLLSEAIQYQSKTTISVHVTEKRTTSAILRNQCSILTWSNEPKDLAFRVFERTRTFRAGIINIRLEHRTFFRLALFEEVPRNL